MQACDFWSAFLFVNTIMCMHCVHLLFCGVVFPSRFFARQLAEFSRAGLRDPVTVRLDAEIKIPELLRMMMFTCRSEEKIGALLYILRALVPDEQQAIVFVSTRQQVDWLCAVLQRSGHTCAPVYGRMDQFMRNANVTRFRTKKARLLIVTDVAARGIDIPLLDNVVNFDFPPRSKLYLHRVGRVARNGRPGSAFSVRQMWQTIMLFGSCVLRLRTTLSLILTFTRSWPQFVVLCFFFWSRPAVGVARRVGVLVRYIHVSRSRAALRRAGLGGAVQSRRPEKGARRRFGSFKRHRRRVY